MKRHKMNNGLKGFMRNAVSESEKPVLGKTGIEVAKSDRNSPFQ
jgi:hypothetical protein